MSRSDRRRFSRAEVWIHAAFAALVLVGLLTAVVLSLAPLSVAVGRRATVAEVHVVSGLLLPVPLALGLLSRAFRADVRLLDRWSADDRAWLRSRDRRSGRLRVVRFNAGQKANAAFTLGAVLLLLGTGLVMRGFLVSWPDDSRTGATLVHDWTAFGLAVAVVGHVAFAARYRRGDAVYPRGQ